MATTAGATDRGCSRRGRRQERGRADYCRRRYRGAVLILESLAEESRGEDRVPAPERSLARAVGIEQRLQRIDRVGQLVTEAPRPGVVGSAGNVVACRDRPARAAPSHRRATERRTAHHALRRPCLRHAQGHACRRNWGCSESFASVLPWVQHPHVRALEFDDVPGTAPVLPRFCPGSADRTARAGADGIRARPPVKHARQRARDPLRSGSGGAERAVVAAPKGLPGRRPFASSESASAAGS